MILQIKSLHADPRFAAEVSGINAKTPLPPDEVAAIDAAMDEHGVLVFRGQPMDQDEQIAWTRQFGPLTEGFKKVTGQNPRLKHHELADISNLGADGKVVDRDHKRIVYNIANQLWHADSSFQKPRAKYSMLSCVHPASWGGETEYTDLRAAYDALPERTKKEIDGLVAEHWALHSRIMLGDDQYTEEQRNAMPPVQWPVVQTHSGSRRKHLYIGVHACKILGMTVPEGRMILMDLLEHATQPQFVYRHQWRTGDLVIWDNRCTLHRGRHYDLGERRELRRSTTVDTESALDMVA
jgi:alpha-ketoglutarate-dependent 2,4-dichlorophenoxyacetate dioxygenase